MKRDCLALALFFFLILSGQLFSESKYSMPDLAQERGYTCFCHAAANLLYWFGQNGYPKLIPEGANENEKKELLVKKLIISCNYTYAKMDDNLERDPQGGLKKYIEGCGYKCEVNYFLINADESGFSDHTLFKDNDRNDIGYLLARGLYIDDGQRMKLLREYGHALTLVHYSDSILAVRDPAHLKNDWGQRTLSLVASKSTDEQNHHLLVMQGYPDNYFFYAKGALPVLMGAFYVRIIPP